MDRVLDVSTGVDQATGAVSMADLSSNLVVLLARKLIKIFKICIYFQPVSHYLVKWRSLPYDESTWEVEVSFIWSVVKLSVTLCTVGKRFKMHLTSNIWTSKF